MQIFCKTLTSNFGSKTIALECEPSDTVRAVKAKFKDKGCLGQRLMYLGKELEDDRTLADYEVQEGATLHMLLPRGGG
jgi:hypothetical protein